MTTPVVKDSFGVEVQVGDYLVYAVKTRYLGSLGLGRVTKISEKGSVSMVVAPSLYGQSWAERVADLEKREAELIAEYTAKGGPIPSWVTGYAQSQIKLRKTCLQDATTCYKLPPYAVPVEITQILEAAK